MAIIMRRKFGVRRVTRQVKTVRSAACSTGPGCGDNGLTGAKELLRFGLRIGALEDVASYGAAWCRWKRATALIATSHCRREPLNCRWRQRGRSQIADRVSPAVWSATSWTGWASW